MVSWLLVVTGALVFFMQAGFAMLCAGCVRKKNVQNTMLKNVLDACGAAVAFYSFGFGFAFGGQYDTKETSFIGTKNFFFSGDIDPAFWFFEYAFSAAAVTIVAGTLAERCQMTAYLCYSLFLSGFVYPVAARALWSAVGFLSAGAAEPFGEVGAIDFAGSGVVHVTGGTIALIAACALGARIGRFHDVKGRELDVPKEIPGHSVALQMMGTMVLWFGCKYLEATFLECCKSSGSLKLDMPIFLPTNHILLTRAFLFTAGYGFNPGSALLLTVPNRGSIAALVAVNTSLSGAAGALSALLTNLYLEERKTGDYAFSLTMAMNGLLTGLVSM
jgi:ammonium transporter, Amt family